LKKCFFATSLHGICTSQFWGEIYENERISIAVATGADHNPLSAGHIYRKENDRQVHEDAISVGMFLC
jgi:hypothetical protein